MKRLLGNTEISAYTAGSAKTFVLATVAVLLVGCGGGDDGPFVTTGTPNPDAEPYTLDDLICDTIIVLLGGDCDSPPPLSDCERFASSLLEPCRPETPPDLLPESPWIFGLAYDVEPNDSISTASAASIPSPDVPERSVGFRVRGTVNNLTDGVDTYAFTADRSRTFVFQLCASWNYCNLLAPGESLDVAIAYISVLDQFGTVLLSSQGNTVNGNFLHLRIDAGMLYYVMVLAEDAVNEEQEYTLQVFESITEPEADVLQESEPNGPILSAGEVMWLTSTLDWIPPTMNVDGTPLLDLAGYNVYFGPASGMYLDFRHLDNPGLVTYVLDLPNSGSWFIVITALDSAGNESDVSNEVFVDVLCECDLPPAGEMP